MRVVRVVHFFQQEPNQPIGEAWQPLIMPFVPLLPAVFGQTSAERMESLLEVSQVSDLLAEVEVRHDRWLRLYREPDVLVDLEKRKRMLCARWDYQEALLAYLACL